MSSSLWDAIFGAATPLPRPPCAHVFLGPFDVCVSCGTPNPATLR